MTTHDLPLFTLHTVLFPGMPLPLHVFEPRYREMIGRCLEEDSRFGVVLIRLGREVGEPAEPYQVGTIAEIIEVQRFEDGRLNLLTIGRERFRVTEITQDAPYLRAAVELMDEDDRVVPEDVVAISQLFQEYVDHFRTVAKQALTPIELPEDPQRLSYLVGAALQVPATELQGLLELPGTRERVAEELDILRRELTFLRTLGASGNRFPETRFSTN